MNSTEMIINAICNIKEVDPSFDVNFHLEHNECNCIINTIPYRITWEKLED